jgi:predicted DNA-binding transcriptional regulator AlpA
MEKLLSAQQVADHLGMHPKTLYKLLRENKIALNFIRLHGRMIAFRPKDVELYLGAHEVVRTGGGKKIKKESEASKLQRKFKGYEIMTNEEAQAFFANVRVVGPASAHEVAGDEDEGRLYIWKKDH